jgi:forespore regulator of the sigma-K checkpoint
MRLRGFITAWVLLLSLFGVQGTEGPVQDLAAEAAVNPSVEVGEPVPIQRTIILQRIYLDGEISEETFEETIISMDDFWRKYDKWLLVDQNDSQLVFQTYVDDISPLLKGNGYFGIKADGTISIFNGKPVKDQVIQSFYQIDMKKLESRQQTELLKGVKIENKERYSQFLEAYKPYSISTMKTLQ